jgi:hypothetical protein
LIREALLRADPTLEIMRADEISAPGAITSDILTRLMHADIVVADITFPNANVFYELGLRHACRTGTIIIREKSGPRAPFDVAHLRHIEYENTPSGLKSLATKFEEYFDHFARNPNSPDSQFQELAKLTDFQFPDYSVGKDTLAPEVEAMLAMMQSPELIDLVVNRPDGGPVDQRRVLEALAKNPAVAGTLMQALARSGHLDLSGASVSDRGMKPRQKPPKKPRRR